VITAKLTPAKFAELAEKLEQEEGLTLTGNAGTLQKNGVTADWKFDGANLTIQVTHHPFIVSAAFCEGELKAALAEQGVVCQ
jgi:hypothetical protein